MPIQHVRKMLPPKREKIAELREETVTIKAEPYFSRDAKSGVLVMEGRTEERSETRSVPTGKMVERFTTGKIVHEGSLIAQDTSCHDCGAGLKPGNDRRYDFYYLVCSRIEDQDNRMVRALHYKDVDGRPQQFTHIRLDEGEYAEPFENGVLECGRAGL